MFHLDVIHHSSIPIVRPLLSRVSKPSVRAHGLVVKKVAVTFSCRAVLSTSGIGIPPSIFSIDRVDQSGILGTAHGSLIQGRNGVHLWLADLLQF